MNQFVDNYTEKGFGIIRGVDTSSIVNSVQEFLACNDLSNIHKKVDRDEINEVRLSLSKSLSTSEMREKILTLVEEQMISLIGPEIAVQKNINVTLHIPQIENNITPLHSDVLCGNSPYEVVVWIPLCETKKTQSMYLFDRETTFEILSSFDKLKCRRKVLEEFKDRKHYLELNVGDILIFSPTLIHGSSINSEDISRISLNLRFKSLHSPFHLKKLNDYFVEIRKLPQTIMAEEYESRL
ncbi:hypothetical protein BIY24_14900 [Halobacteriovorax marinus]|uniref:sporadic carbohydrate cluster 2OG-Fe(II) oxygenase n=1 Tax=Halobacteriovorax marinus TaxID=97084 RepID=UPI000BC35A91|nr:sporadic carbohydrate cluster 2OG-Fe(II) oxygenase [Halobacteriovorax marinus]ATH09186.1 hypothetical protein BIY24_14900 [Halobacteriovorax marinus]